MNTSTDPDFPERFDQVRGRLPERLLIIVALACGPAALLVPGPIPEGRAGPIVFTVLAMPLLSVGLGWLAVGLVAVTVSAVGVAVVRGDGNSASTTNGSSTIPSPG